MVYPFWPIVRPLCERERSIPLKPQFDWVGATDEAQEEREFSHLLLINIELYRR